MKKVTCTQTYILDENKNVIPASILEWRQFLENDYDNKIVNQEEISNYVISTIFLGIDHNPEWSPEVDENYKPHIFETIIFKDDNSDIYCRRYSTWEEAGEGHQKAIEWITLS